MFEAHGSIQVYLSHTRSTKNTERYDATEDEAPIATIYIQKSAFEGIAVPKVIQVSVTNAD